MIKICLVLFGCLLANCSSVELYSSLRVYQFKDYSTVKFLQFDLDRPASVARWSLFFAADQSCRGKSVNFHFHLQPSAYPLVNLYNDSFPENYISTRHDLTFFQLNQTFPNGTIRIGNPRLGRWFAATFVEDPFSSDPSKSSLKSCSFTLTTKLETQLNSSLVQIASNQTLPIVFDAPTSTIDVSFFTSPDDLHLNASFDFNTQCQLNVLLRLNALADRSQFDQRFVCSSGLCTIALGQYSASIWIYFQIFVDPSSCPSGPIRGTMLIQSFDPSVRSDPMQRAMSNGFYEFVYLPMSTLNSSVPVELNAGNRSKYVQEFSVDDRNLGGTLHLDSQSETSNGNVSVRLCLTKFRPEFYEKCEEDFRWILTQNSSMSRSLPYPEMAPWFLTSEFFCNASANQCDNTSIFLRTRLSSSACTREACGEYGFCRLLTSQQNLYSTCSCIAGFRGYGCTDNRQSFLWKFLPSVLFLTLSNLLFIPAIGMAIYYRLYLEALIYFFNMFFSTFYHACDQDLFHFCIFKYDGLQLADFIGSYASFIVTLMSMSLIRRSVKVFLFMLGVLACVAINARDRFGTTQFIVLVSLTFAFTLSTWIYKSVQHRRIHPSWKILLTFIPGFALSITGLLLFVLVETDENYWYIHSMWHIFMAISILFFLPRQKRVKSETTVIPSNSIVNPVAVGQLDGASENSHL